MERASGEGTHGGCIFSEWRVGEEWVLQSEGCFRVGAKFQSGGCQRRVRVEGACAHRYERPHANTHTREAAHLDGERDSGCVSPRVPKGGVCNSHQQYRFAAQIKRRRGSQTVAGAWG